MFVFAMVVVWGTRDVAQELFNATYLFFGLAMIAIALAAYRGKSCQRGFSWLVLMIGIGLAVFPRQTSRDWC